MCYIFHKLLNRQLFYKTFERGIWYITSQRSCKAYEQFCKNNKSGDTLPKNNISQRTKTAMSELDNKIFRGLPDRYKGVTIDSTEEKCETVLFLEKLQESLKIWTDKGIRGVWFKIAVEHADWVPILAKNGFVFHHAQSEYLMMYRWLPTTEESNAPRFAHTMIGVGAVVVNDVGEILVVREKYFPKGYPHWKLPGGYVEAGEDLEDAAIREVLEETSIETKFQFLVSFRHTHGVNFGCSDIYFIVGLAPITSEIKKCEREIVAAEWMKVEEYMQHPHVHETNRYFVQKYLEYKAKGTIIGSQKGTHPLLKRPYTVFHIDDLPPKEEEKADKIDKSKI